MMYLGGRERAELKRLEEGEGPLAAREEAGRGLRQRDSDRE